MPPSGTGMFNTSVHHLTIVYSVCPFFQLYNYSEVKTFSGCSSNLYIARYMYSKQRMFMGAVYHAFISPPICAIITVNPICQPISLAGLFAHVIVGVYMHIRLA